MEMNKCKRCGNQWYPRVPLTKMCPRCKSYYWDEDRDYEGKRKTNSSRKIDFSCREEFV